MKTRLFSALLIPLVGLSTAALASQPSGPVAKLVPNPLVVSVIPGAPEGLPGVTCGGIIWVQDVQDSVEDPAAPMVLDLSLVPFRSRETVLIVEDAAHTGALALVRFNGGLVNGLPYNRTAWNDVVVTLHPAEQEYVLRVNGAEAGPFPFSAECAAAGGCFGVGLIVLNGGFGDDGVAWLDSLSLVRQTADFPPTILEIGFDFCSLPGSVLFGGMFITDPPRSLRSAR
jgi:hypothetical protein